VDGEGTPDTGLITERKNSDWLVKLIPLMHLVLLQGDNPEVSTLKHDQENPLKPFLMKILTISCVL